MKKIISFLCIVVLFGTFAGMAQLKVSSNGNVTIKPNSTATPLSALSVGDTGEQNVTATAYKTTSGYNVRARLAGQYSTNWDYGVSGESSSKGSNFHVGVWASALSNTVNSFGRAFGVLGVASNSTPGYNIGVYGGLIGSNSGAGIVGAVGEGAGIYIPGTYAGYFLGNVRVTGTVTATNLTSSDIRLKTNVLSLNNKNTKFLNSVLSMNPVEYNLKQVYHKDVGDTATVQTKLYDEKSQQFQKKHFGLIAQELKEIYPELVYEEDDGYLSIDYTGLIPVLIQSIKELKSQVDDLKNTQSANASMASLSENTQSEDGSLLPFLYQNAPNPFKEKTEIRYFVPESVKIAQISIYTIQGALLKQVNISQRGEGVHVVYGGELTPGVYLYSLIADSRQVDVKKMIVTK